MSWSRSSPRSLGGKFFKNSRLSQSVSCCLWTPYSVLSAIAIGAASCVISPSYQPLFLDLLATGHMLLFHSLDPAWRSPGSPLTLVVLSFKCSRCSLSTAISSSLLASSRSTLVRHPPYPLLVLLSVYDGHSGIQILNSGTTYPLS